MNLLLTPAQVSAGTSPPQKRLPWYPLKNSCPGHSCLQKCSAFLPCFNFLQSTYHFMKLYFKYIPFQTVFTRGGPGQDVSCEHNKAGTSVSEIKIKHTAPSNKSHGGLGGPGEGGCLRSSLSDSMWLTGSWCSGQVSGLSLWGERAELRTFVHQQPPGPI